MDPKSFKDTFTGKRKSVFFTLGAIVLLLCLTLVSALMLRNSNLANLSSAGNKNALDNLNRQIVSRIEKYRKANLPDRAKINKDIRVIAQTRKSLLSKEIKNDPQAFLNHAVLSDKITVLPKSTQELFEKKVNTKVNVRVLFSDNLKTGKNTSLYQAVTMDNTNPVVYNLTIIKEPSGMVRPATIISGVSLDNDLIVPELKVDITPKPTLVSAKTPQQLISPRNSASGNQHTLVIIFKFSSNPNPTPALPDKATVLGRVFSDSTSVNSYLKETSYNNLSLYGEVTNILTISSSPDNCNTNYESWGTAADAAARTAGYTPDPTVYQRIIYLFPSQPSCSFAGISVTDTNPTVVNNKIFLNGNFSSSVIAHEVIHNLEIVGAFWQFVQHAYAINCKTKAIDVLANCSEVDGQNNYDLMNSISYDPNPQHVPSSLKYNLGWMSSPKIQDVAASGTYLLDKLELNTASLQSLRIARRIDPIDQTRPSTEYYFVDYRMPLLFDNLWFFQNAYAQGVEINLWTSDSRSDPKLRKYTSYLVDTSPGDNDFTNASLKVGGTFTDSTNPNKVITITRLADLNNKAQLQVTVSSGIPTPTLTLTPTSTPVIIPTPTNTVTPTATNTPIPSVIPTQPPYTVCTDNSQCNSGYTCVEDCGPPVYYLDPSSSLSPTPYLWHCLNPAEAANRLKFGCPICLSYNTKILTPSGERQVQELKSGDAVMTLNKKGLREAVLIKQVSSVSAPPGHRMVDLILKDGRELFVSPNHPLYDGRFVKDINDGEIYDGAQVVSHRLTDYAFTRTYDLLSEGETGYYFANGILMASTLK